MTAKAAARSLGPGHAGLALALALAAAASGALFAVAAYRMGPVSALAGFVLLAFAVASLARPEIAAGVALVLLGLGNLGHLGSPPWLLGTLWCGWALAVALLRRPEGARAAPPLALPVLAFAGVTAVGLLLTDHPGNALPAVRALASGVCLFWAIAIAVRHREQALWIVGAAGAVALAFGASALLSPGQQEVGFITTGGSVVDRLTLGYLLPNLLGGLLILLVPVVVAGAILQPRARPVWAAIAVLTVLTVVATYSRGAIVALPAALLPFLNRRQVGVAAAVVALGLAFAAPGLLRERFATISTSSAEVASRFDIWDAAVDIWTSAPVLGAGVGEFPFAYAEGGPSGRSYLPGSIFAPPPHAHNQVLQLLSEQGVVGLLAFLVVIGAAIRLAWRLRREGGRYVAVMASAVLAAVLALLVHGIFDVTLFESPAVWFWALLGLLSATAVMHAEAQEP